MPTLQWEAIYKDGSRHLERDLQTSENIDRSQLAEFRLFSGEKLVFAYFNNEKRKLIFRRRVFLNPAGIQGILYLVGWHENVKGVSVKSICYIYEDGHIEFDDARNDLELVPCELI